MAGSDERAIQERCFSALLRWQDESVGDRITSEEYAEAVRVTKCDSSSPLNPANWAKFPHNKHGLKMHVRSGVSPEVRKELWLDLLGVIEDDLVLFAKAYREPSQGEKAWARDEHIYTTTPSTVFFFPQTISQTR